MSSLPDFELVDIPFSTKRALAAQRMLANKVKLTPLPSTPETVAAADVCYRASRGFASAVVSSYPECRTLGLSCCSVQVSVPYIPGLLAFRETRPVFCALAKLKREFDLVLVNGHGRSHPRLFGLASHIGLLLNKPTVGVAKEPIGDLRSAYNAGNLSKVRSGCWVSPGHMILLEEAVHIVELLVQARVDNPLQLAHKLSRRMMESD